MLPSGLPIALNCLGISLIYSCSKLCQAKLHKLMGNIVKIVIIYMQMGRLLETKVSRSMQGVLKGGSGIECQFYKMTM